ncbi:MAG: iron-sulfur cluster assembly protein [Chloroflexota bacterium]|nr:iron-sulfur cluster assembly protein [Chloroflexota bacterium]
MSPAGAVSEGAVFEALRGVVDPELDESVVELGFVDGVRLDGDSVTVGLRLPTFWCAPNFAYLMARDTRDRVLRVPGVGRVRVILKDHFASDEISAGVTEGRAFEEVFPGEAEGDLDALRAQFRAKAFTMRQEQLVRFLLDGGLSCEEVVALRVGDVEDATDRAELVLRVGGSRRVLRGGAPLARAYLDKRRQVGLDGAPRACLVTDQLGGAIAAGELPAYLRRTRMQRVSMALNTTLCRGLLEARYGPEGAEMPRRESAHAQT